MALICMAIHSLRRTGRIKYTEETLNGLKETVDFSKHRLIVINNNSDEEVKSLIDSLTFIHTKIHLSENIGTAGAINLGLKFRLPNEVCIKMDDDVVVHQSEWVDELEQAITERPEIGICGLKRDDVYGNFIADGKFLFGDDIMGTCTALNPLLLDKIGFFRQPSQYGYDDAILCARSLAVGFKNCFLPHIKITHLDDGKNAYCDWKKKEAGKYLHEVSIMLGMYKSGKLNPYYDGGLND